MSKMILVAVLVLMILPTAALQAGTGTIEGRVFDAESGVQLPGVGVLVVGTTKGASTDLDGRYTITRLDPGAYDVRFSLLGYQTKIVTGIAALEGETTKLDVSLERIDVRDAFRIEDMIVSADRVQSTGAAVLAERRRSAVIGDAISRDMIAMSPDATSGDALKRVTGISIVEEKYVFVRGVTDRYNETALDGVTVSSTDTDADKKSFSFDLIPASFISNTVVIKTATPDMPGNFSGGFVQINTLEFPEHRVLELSLKGGHNTMTTGNRMLISQGGDTDWRGTDDGSREFPDGLTGNNLARALPNNWEPQRESAGLDGSYQLAWGDRIRFGENEFGLMAAGTYKHSHQIGEITESPSHRGTTLFRYDGFRYKRSVLLGGLINVNYKIGGRHKFGLKTNIIQGADDRVAYSEGLPASGNWTKRTTIEWEERTLKLAQLSGSHLFPRLAGLELTWRGNLAGSKASEPDRKHVEFQKGATGDWYAFRDNYRTWANLQEYGDGFEAEASGKLGSARIKTGYLYGFKEREYDIQAWATDPSSVRRPNHDLLILPIDTVFSAQHYGPNMFTFVPITVFTGAYQGEHTNKAAFGMLDAPFSIFDRRLRLAGGLRYEDSKQIVHTVKAIDDPEPLVTRVTNSDFLPSANLTWMASEKTNLRLAYFQSVNRPEFRELANVLYYDFDRIQNIQGNPNLRRALISNYDARIEFFPGLGEVVATSVFYKTLTDAIEERLKPTPERYLLTWFNSPSGRNYGYELEMRKSLGLIGDRLENITLAGNFTRVISEIDYTDTRTDAEGNAIVTRKKRVMQGQSPWTINVSLLFIEPRFGFSLGVLYNRIGRRLDAVGDERDQDIYEESRDVLDLAATKRVFTERIRLKFTARNVLDSEYVFTSGPDAETHSRLKTGTTYDLSLAINF